MTNKLPISISNENDQEKRCDITFSGKLPAQNRISSQASVADLIDTLLKHSANPVEVSYHFPDKPQTPEEEDLSGLSEFDATLWKMIFPTTTKSRVQASSPHPKAIQISISEENEQGIRTFTLTGELPKQTEGVTIGSHVADLIDSLLSHQGKSTKPQCAFSPKDEIPTYPMIDYLDRINSILNQQPNSTDKPKCPLIKRATPPYDDLDQELIDRDPILL